MGDDILRAEIKELRQLLEESESTLSAIRNGEVDALVIGGKEIYTLEGADHPYRVFVEAMRHGAVTISSDGSIIYCNASFSKMVKRPADKVIGVGIQTLFAAADLPTLSQRLSVAHTVAQQAELTLKADDGSRVPVLVSFNLLTLSDVSAVCLVIADLTEHKQNQQLQDTDRRKDEFLAMLAHELRNPLAPITNAAHMLSLWNEGKNKKISWACEVVLRQVGQMTRIVDDLLDVSRITRGKIQLQKDIIEVSSIISAAVETSRPLIESRRHTLNVQLAPDSIKVEADLTRMSQVVTNLLNNAAKYTEEGGEIWLSSQRDGSDATISVRDSGVGIPAELLPTVFDLFTQADRTIDRSQGGLGIGLTLVRSLVEMHQGSVSVLSEGLGKGCEFVVRLPLAVTAKEHDNDRLADVSDDPVMNPQRILVVDDNTDSAISLAMMLNAMGHEAIVAHDGPAALESAASVRPDLILLDIGLPGMNGYVVVEQMRSNLELRDVTIAALTGYGDDQDRMRSKEAGFDYHFVKPLDLRELDSVIRTLGETRPTVS